MTTAAVILCGGRSRRMGRPKAWLPFGAECLLQRVVRLAGGGGPVVVVAAPDQDLPALPGGVRIVRDPVEGRGPLQGLAAGLAALPAGVELAYLTATDVPFLLPEWIAQLARCIEGFDLAMPFAEGFHHPLAALYRVHAVGPAVGRLLGEERLRPVFLMESVQTRLVEEDELRAVDPDLLTLRNLNTPEDYRAALVRAGMWPDEVHRPRVVAELFGVPRLRAGVGRLEVEAQDVGEALRALARACPALEGSVIADRGVHPAYRVCLNGRHFPTDPATPLADGESLLLMAADVGG